MTFEGGEKAFYFSLGFGVVRMRSSICIDEMTDQPRPNGSLMICRVARRRSSLVDGNISRIARAQGMQSGVGQEFVLDFVDDGAGAFCVEHRMRQAYGKDLIWPDRRVIAAPKRADRKSTRPELQSCFGSAYAD